MSLPHLCDKLGYRFRNMDILREALTHPSHGHELRRAMPDNQRLEFLGDAVLQLAVTGRLFELHPNLTEGELTALRARLVNRTQMKHLAEQLDLGAELILGKGEESNKGRSRGSNLADAMEAIFGAIYLDGGWEAARDLVLRLLAPALADLNPQAISGNPKGTLQERLQSRGDEPPEYQTVEESGPPHSRVFEVSVSWRGKELGRGRGSSKKEAETRAAENALNQLEQ
jgi:ribonuclease-3